MSHQIAEDKMSSGNAELPLTVHPQLCQHRLPTATFNKEKDQVSFVQESETVGHPVTL